MSWQQVGDYATGAAGSIGATGRWSPVAWNPVSSAVHLEISRNCNINIHNRSSL